jgi:ABC-type glycerol-3-phosphate transport system substrate-binding protein
MQTATGDPNNQTDKMLAKMDQVETKYNFTFNWIPFVSSGWRVVVNFNEVALAGGDWADVVWDKNRYAFPVQASRNLVHPIDDLFDFTNDPVFNTRYVKTTALWKGKVYGLQTMPFGMPDYGMFYRKNLLTAAGLPDPIALYNDGNWTWDVFFDMAVQATRDFNNDGIIDQYGLCGDVYDIYQALLVSNGSSVVDYLPATQSFELGYEKPAALKALTRINDIVNTMKIIRKDTFMTLGADPGWSMGSSAFLLGHSPGNYIADPNILWMALPKGPDNLTANPGIARDLNYWAFTTTIGDDWQDVVTATGAFFTRDYDYIRWKDLDKNTIWNKTAWQDANRSTWPGPGNIEHIAGLTFDQGGTEAIQTGAWSSILTIIADNIVQKIVVQGIPVVTALDMHREECQTELDSLLAI